MQRYLVNKDNANLEGTIPLDGSKSISNRVLIIQALCNKSFTISNLSTSDDTKAMQKALEQKNSVIDVGAAGTTMRFLTAYCATQTGEWILTGSERMKQRPIGVLVDALRALGANISYLENEGCPPLKIVGCPLVKHEVTINAGVSSQYISALLMIAPCLENGLTLHLQGKLVSRPYIEMTLRMMHFFGIHHNFEGNTIRIEPQTYVAKDFMVEADWSAASYWYAMAALSETVNLTLTGLFEDSLQGDSILAEMMKLLGINTSFTNKKINLSKIKASVSSFNYDFVKCPDLAQTLATTCAGLGISAHFDGLITLSIKETDRTAALQNELNKFGVLFTGSGNKWSLSPAQKEFKTLSTVPQIATYHDHRMAMAFAPLAQCLPNGIIIENPMVVTKSYPRFWEDLTSVGYEIREL